jgi:hypothetical protein
MLLGLIANGAVIHDGAARNGDGPIVNHHRRIDEIAVCVLMAYAQLCDLARRARDIVLMALGARGRIECRPQTVRGIVNASSGEFVGDIPKIAPLNVLLASGVLHTALCLIRRFRQVHQHFDNACVFSRRRVKEQAVIYEANNGGYGSALLC